MEGDDEDFVSEVGEMAFEDERIKLKEQIAIEAIHNLKVESKMPATHFNRLVETVHFILKQHELSFPPASYQFARTFV